MPFPRGWLSGMLAILLVASAPAAGAQPPSATSRDAQAMQLHYPPTRTVNQIDDYHGTPVADPYRWLEDLDGAPTREWVDAENKVTFRYLEQLPRRQALKDRLTKLWNFERFGIPFREGSRYFYLKNDGLQNQAVLYTMRALEDAPSLLLDPNTLSKDGTVALSGTSISPDGKYLAYGLSSAGSDWVEWRVRDVETGQDLPDVLKWVKFSGASWTKDGKGFYYSRYDEPQGNQLQEANFYQKLFYHRLGDDQARDTLIYERKDHKDWGFYGGVTDDGRYLILSISQGTDPRNRIYYQDLQASRSAVIPLLDDFDARYDFIGNEGPFCYFLTTHEAPRGRVIRIDLRHPERPQWFEVVSESRDSLESVSMLNHMLVASYLHDAQAAVHIFNLDGKKLRDVHLPGIGSVSGFGGHQDDTETFYAFTSFTHPSTIYRYDLTTGQSQLFRQPKVDFDPSAYVTRQVFFRSKDGTRVPMFLSYRRDLKLDGKRPTYLYGYGGFNISLTPSFSVSNLVWMEMGGIYAVPNLRGGGEYGESWHESGTKLHKQNVFNDFIAAAEYLIAKKYTCRDALAIGGGSNGGLLVGACLTQRPDLFGAALPAVGVLDMLRFQKFTIGWAWTSDYGSSDDPAEFKALYAYSPYHRVHKGIHYPATLITTGDHDDRVVPSHSFKFAAALQAAQGGTAPILIRIETRAGHGAGKPTAKLIEEAADRWAFLAHQLGLDR